MKKVSLFICTFLITILIANNSYAICVECPEIQREIKKEITFTKQQKQDIKKIKKDMHSQIKFYQKQYKQNQKHIDKILNEDCPDIILMMQIKRENSKIKLDIDKTKKEALAQIFEVYTEDQQITAKRILSENSGITQKKKCEFCGKDIILKKQCKKCIKKD